MHHNTDPSVLPTRIFWSFMILVLFIPGLVALITLGIIVHLVNYVSILPVTHNIL